MKRKYQYVYPGLNRTAGAEIARRERRTAATIGVLLGLAAVAVAIAWYFAS